MSAQINKLPGTRKPPQRDAFTVFFVLGMERLTRSLRDGDEYGPEGFAQLEKMARRCQAFVNAFEDRKERAINERNQNSGV